MSNNGNVFMTVNFPHNPSNKPTHTKWMRVQEACGELGINVYQHVVGSKVLSVAHLYESVVSAAKNDENTDFIELVKSKIEESMMDVRKYVFDYGGTPDNYMIVSSNPDQCNSAILPPPYIIEHSKLPARINATFASIDDVRAAFVDMFLGKHIANDKLYDFILDGQKLLFTRPIFETDLPEKPIIAIHDVRFVDDNQALSTINIKNPFMIADRKLQYVSNCDILDEHVCAEISALAQEWSDVIKSILHIDIDGYANRVFSNIFLDRLNENVHVNIDNKVLRNLRRAYPELTLLNNRNLYKIYGDYKREEWYHNIAGPNKEINRETEFFLYVLWRLLVKQLKSLELSTAVEDNEAEQYWQIWALIVFYYIVTGSDLRQAMDVAIACRQYVHALQEAYFNVRAVLIYFEKRQLK